MKLKATIIRLHTRTDEVMGICHVTDETNNSILMFSTLEPIKCIPTGFYTVVKVPPSNKINYPHFLVLNVPNYSGICFHIGNFANGKQIDTLGCILVGQGFKDINNDSIPDLINSTLVFNRFVNLMPDIFRLQII